MLKESSHNVPERTATKRGGAEELLPLTYEEITRNQQKDFSVLL